MQTDQEFNDSIAEFGVFVLEHAPQAAYRAGIICGEITHTREQLKKLRDDRRLSDMVCANGRALIVAINGITTTPPPIHAAARALENSIDAREAV